MSTASLSLPHGASPYPQAGRPPSPLRNGFIPNTSTGIDPRHYEDDDSDDEHGNWKMRSPSPASSVSQLAVNLAQGVRSFVSGMAPRSPGSTHSSLPTDAELEAEAEIERDRARREAERIISRESMDRRLVEDRVLEMIENTRGLPPPPSRSQTLPPPNMNPPSPSGSQKDSWWQAAKNRLTPTKDKELTPAQQVIHDTKAKEKERKKDKKDSKGKDRDWLSNPDGYSEPAFVNHNAPFATPRRPLPSSPSSPTPRSNMPPNLTPSPSRANLSTVDSPSREPLPMYAQFDQHGTLDVHVTLLTIAKRFEKLEKWTVGHVRALEERMGDVERWLVEKEQEKEKNPTSSEEGGALSLSGNTGHSRFGDDTTKKEVSELRDELHEMQSRMGELGREIARMATAPGNLASGPSTGSAEIMTAPKTESSIVEHEFGLGSPPLESSPLRYPSSTARHSTSPPLSTSKYGSGGSRRSKLPYPSGDYATPPDSSFIQHNSRPSSPEAMLGHGRAISIPGLPPIAATNGSLDFGGSAHTPSSPTNSGSDDRKERRTSSPSPFISDTARSVTRSPVGSPANMGAYKASPSTSSNGAAPALAARVLASSRARPGSVSPTPTPKQRKRYTVALGAPLVPPPDIDDTDEEKNTTAQANDDDTPFDADETIGKSRAKSIVAPKSASAAPTTIRSVTPIGSTPITGTPRTRSQSTYGAGSAAALALPGGATTPGGTRPLNITPSAQRMRSKSTDRLYPHGSSPTSTPNTLSGKEFVDPLVLRRQQDVSRSVHGTPKPPLKTPGKVPIEDLVKFFDGGKPSRK